MINPDQIEEWIHEVEQRPSSATLIIEFISRRLRDLTARNEELLAENISLRMGKKVEEYETKIANLEYQLDLLRRQMGGETPLMPAQVVETISLLVYSPKGQILRRELPIQDLSDRAVVASLSALSAGGPPRVLVTSATEELLFVYDSGRAVALPVTDIPAAEGEQLDWKAAHLVEARGGEELAVVIPVARMTLFEYCLQTSRRGCVKRMMKASFESHIAKNFVGSGIKSKPDKTCDLILCGRDDQLVLATREGYLVNLEVSQLPYTIEEVFKIGPTDYVVSSFVLGKKPSLLIVTQNGKAVNRDTGWLEKPASFKSRGQPVFSQARRDAGIRVAGAAAVDADDWGLSLDAEGRLTLHKVAALLESGSLELSADVVDFTTFAPPAANTAGAAATK